MPHGNGYSQPEREYRKLLQSIVLLIVLMAVFEMVNGALNIALLISQQNESAERSRVTREVVVATGYCLKQQDINTQQEIEICVEKTLGRSLEEQDESE
jgi:hypothetical protein